MKTTEFTKVNFFDQDVVKSTVTQNHKPFVPNDYLKNMSAKKALIEEYKSLNTEGKKSFKDLRAYFNSKGYEELSSIEKNYQFIMEESTRRMNDTANQKLLYIDNLSADSDVFELLHSFENIDKLKQLYKFQKKTSESSGINNIVAEQIKYCLLQGRELFIAGKHSATSVKPLMFFYSITAYAFGAIVLNNPIRFGLDSLNGHHGLDYSHDEFGVKLGGDMPYGTFTDLFQSFPVTTIIDLNMQMYKQNNIKSIDMYFDQNTKIKLGSLFSYIPELSNSILPSTGNSSFCKPMNIKTTTVGRDLGYELLIGDGIESLNSNHLDTIFCAKSSQVDGKLKYLITDKTFQTLNLTIYQDIYGGLYFIDDKIGYVIPEIMIHFMILFAFSNIQRYDPPLWGEILSNQIDSNISYLIYRYLSVFENKLPYLLLRLIGENYPVLKIKI